MWRLIGAVIIVQSHMILGKLIGDHICQSEESYPANVTEYRLRNATFRNYKWCMNVPPRCSYYTVKTINESRIVEKILTRTVEKCCEGYTEENEKCVLKCKEQCKNGKCIDGICTCSSGFKGASCDVGCDPGTWGPNCSSICNCESKTCDPINGTCLEEAQTTYTTSPKPSTPSQISINGKVSKFTIIAPSTSTGRTSLMTDKSTNATDSINHTESTTQRSHASSNVATTNESSTLNEGRLTEAPSSTSATTRLENVTQSTTSVTNSRKSFTTKSTQQVPESTTSSYQPEQYISGSSISLGASVTTPPFLSTLEHTTSLKPTQGFSQTVPPKTSSFGETSTTRVTISKSKETSLVSSNLSTFVASSTEQVLIDTTVSKATPSTQMSSTISTEDKVVTATSEQVFLDTTVTKSTPTTQRSSSTEVYFNESVILKEPLTTPMLETKSTTSWVNNISRSESTTTSNMSVKIYSNDITENHPNTSPIAISTPIPPKHAKDHLDKPADVINLTKNVSNNQPTKESSLDDILKEYTIPVEVKYEIPAHKKEADSTHENYAEEKNYLTLEDRGYINKHVASDSEYFVNSFTGVAVVVLVVAVLVMIVFGWNSWRGKKALESRDPGRKDAAVYTTSIFHTPLPDPPIIENPTYLLTTIDCKKCNGETLLLKAHTAYPIHRMSQMGEVREYVYDHPPSTGSYRAASAVDPSDVSCSYTATEISEPVYDEIPLRNGVYNNVLGANTEPNMCLYVNTVGRTKF